MFQWNYLLSLWNLFNIKSINIRLKLMKWQNRRLVKEKVPQLKIGYWKIFIYLWRWRKMMIREIDYNCWDGTRYIVSFGSSKVKIRRHMSLDLYYRSWKNLRRDRPRDNTVAIEEIKSYHIEQSTRWSQSAVIYIYIYYTFSCPVHQSLSKHFYYIYHIEKKVLEI